MNNSTKNIIIIKRQNTAEHKEEIIARRWKISEGRTTLIKIYVFIFIF